MSMTCVGTVETRVPRAGLPGPTTLFRKFSLRTRLSTPGEPREGFFKLGEPREGFSLARHPLQGGRSEHRPQFCYGSRQRLGEAFQPRGGFPSPRRKLCLRDRAHMGSAPTAKSWARLRAVTIAPQLPFSCIKQPATLHQAKGRQELPL